MAIRPVPFLVAGCEEIHAEIRQILGKKVFCFDELVPADLAVPISCVSLSLQESLGGRTSRHS